MVYKQMNTRAVSAPHAVQSMPGEASSELESFLSSRKRCNPRKQPSGMSQGNNNSLNKAQSSMSSSRMLNFSIFALGRKQRAQFAAGCLVCFIFLGFKIQIRIPLIFKMIQLWIENSTSLYSQPPTIDNCTPLTTSKMQIVWGELWYCVTESDERSPFLTSAFKMKTGESDLANPRQPQSCQLSPRLQPSWPNIELPVKEKQNGNWRKTRSNPEHVGKLLAALEKLKAK